MKTFLLTALTCLGLCGLCVSQSEEMKPFELKTLLGETLHNCRIIKATPAALTLAHDNGVSKVGFDNLDDTWRGKFHYDPDKAHDFEKVEEKNRQLAEAKRKELNKQRERVETKQMKELAEVEKKQLEVQAKRDKEREKALLDAAAKQAANGKQSPPLAPFPGDPNNQVMTTTEIVVPPVTPLGTPYTPGVNKSQTYVYPNGGYYVVPGNGTIYITPGYPYPYGQCPPGYNRSGATGQISIGPTVIRIGP